MQKKIGKRLAGVVSGVTEFGVFVRIDRFPDRWVDPRIKTRPRIFFVR